jgi:hypothetical protein
MIFESDNVSLTIIDEPTYTCGSDDNLRSYLNEYNLEPEYLSSSIYGLSTADGKNCVILANGGPSRVSEYSAIMYESKVWVGIGDQLVCLSLPSLDMLWNLKVDDASCFGIYISPDGSGLLIHGELDISKVSFSGEILWSSGGKDIFTGDFNIYKEYVEAVDFNNEKYHIDLESGTSKLV